MATKHIDDLLNLFAVLALLRRVSAPGAPHTQRLTQIWQPHVLITAKRRHGPVNAGEPILCDADGELTASRKYAA